MPIAFDNNFQVQRFSKSTFVLVFSVLFLCLGGEKLVAQAPGNDTPCGAFNVDVNNALFTPMNDEATTDVENNLCPGNSNKSVWYKFQLATGNTEAHFRFQSQGHNLRSLIIGTFPNGCTEEFILINEKCSPINLGQSRVAFKNLSDNIEYYVQFGGRANETFNNFQMEYSEQSVTYGCSMNASCTTAELVHFGPTQNNQASGYTSGCTYNVPITGSINAGGCFNYQSTASVWYQIDKDYSLMSVELYAHWDRSYGPMQITLWGGTCGSLTPIECLFLANEDPIDFLNNRVKFGTQQGYQDYYLEIGFANNASTEFDLEIRGLFDNDPSSLTECQVADFGIQVLSTSFGSPPEGPFLPGEEVEFSFDILWNPNGQNNDCQWLHGVIPTFGLGWDPQYIQWEYEGPLAVTQEWNTNVTPFYWRTLGVVFLNDQYDLQQSFPYRYLKPGWFASGNPSTSTTPGVVAQDYCPNSNVPNIDPNCSNGIQQNCGNLAIYTFSFILKVKENVDCENDAINSDLTVGFETFSDGQSGAYFQRGCKKDKPIVKNYALVCCPNNTSSVELSTNLGPNAFSGCEIDLTRIEAEIVGGSGSYNYAWTVPYQSSPIVGPREVDILAPGVYTVSTIDLIFGCGGTATATVELFATPEVQLLPGADVFICANSPGFPVDLAAIPIGGTGGFLFEWFGPAGFSSSGQTATVTETGLYSVNVYDANGCFTTESIQVTVGNPEVTFDIPAQICPTIDPIDILKADPPGGVFFGNGVVNGLFEGATPGIYLIGYEVVDINGCTATDEFPLEVSETPEVFVEFPNNICPSSDEQDILIPTPAGGTYDPSPILVDGKIAANASAGNYTITYRYGDPSTPCNESFTFNININDLPQVEVMVSEPVVCLGNDPLNIITASPNGGTFITGNVNSNLEFLPEQLGINEIIYEYTNPATGCSNTTVTLVEVIESDIAEINDPGDLCQDANTTVELSAFPSGGIFTGNGVTTDGFFSPDFPGNYTITYEVNAPGGCNSTTMIELNVLEAPLVAVVFPEEICQDAAPIFLNTTPAGGTFNGNVNTQGEFIPSQLGLNDLVYSFEDTQGCRTDFSFSIDVLETTDPVIIGFPTAPCFSQSDVYQLIAEPAGGSFTGNVNASGEFIPNALGMNTITYGPGPDNPCIGNTTIEIEVIPALNVSVDFPTVVCRSPLAMDILEASPQGGTWSGPVTADGLFQAFELGLNEVTYTFTDPITGCTGSNTFEIEVTNDNLLAQPTLLTPNTPTYCIYEIVQFCIDPVPEAQDYRWTSNLGIIENATPNHLCINIAWNALVQDEVCVTPIGECGASPVPLCFDVEIIDDTSCIIIATGTENPSVQDYKIFPNPTKGNVNISASSAIRSVQLIDAIGQTVLLRNDINQKDLLLDLDKVAAGIYFIRVNEEFTKKLILIK